MNDMSLLQWILRPKKVESSAAEVSKTFNRLKQILLEHEDMLQKQFSNENVYIIQEVSYLLESVIYMPIPLCS